MALVKKDTNLKRRLDNLEIELNNLNASIRLKRAAKHLTSSSSSSSLLPNPLTKVNNVKRLLSKDPNQKTKKEAGKEWFTCLQSITNSIARGSDAIRKIASLTELSTVAKNEYMDKLGNFAPSDPGKIPYLQDAKIGPSVAGTNAVQGSVNIKISSPDGHNSSYKTLLSKSSSHYSAVNNRLPPTYSHSESEISRPNISSGQRTMSECKQQILRENQMLKQKLSHMDSIKEEVIDLKKKLKEEKIKRISAEKNVINPEKKNCSPTPLEGNLWPMKKLLLLEKELNEEKSRRMKAECNLLDYCKQIKPQHIQRNIIEKFNLLEKCLKEQMELKKAAEEKLEEVMKGRGDQFPVNSIGCKTSVEKIYAEEKERCEELEKELMCVLEKLEESENRTTDMTEGKNLALALADRFRKKIESKGKPHLDRSIGLLHNLRVCQKQNLELAAELDKMKEAKENKLLEKYKSMVNQLEAELTHLRRNRKNPLEEPEVTAALEKQKSAYSELVNAKHLIENQNKEHQKSLETEIQRLQLLYDTKIKEFTEVIHNLSERLNEKNKVLDKLSQEKYSLDDVLTKMKDKVSNLNSLNEHQEKQINHLTEILQTKDKNIELIGKELEAAHISLDEHKRNIALHNDNLNEKNEVINRLQSEIRNGKDSCSIQQKMLDDQAETILSLKKTSESLSDNIRDLKVERDQYKTKVLSLELQNQTLTQRITELKHQMMAMDKYKEGQERNGIMLKQLESQVHERQKEWENQVTLMCKEKDQAVQTAKFATQKLVQAVNDYETQISAYKKLQRVLNVTIQEKDHQLNLAYQQLDELNEENWVNQKRCEAVRLELEGKLREACKVCTDVLEDYPQSESTCKNPNMP